jgi:hypothetical protein
MSGIEIAGAWLSIFLTLCVLSFLYDDNPVYKLAEHLFLGVSIGYGVIEIYYGVFKPNLLDKLFGADTPTLQRVLWVVPLVLIAMLFSKLIPKYSWLARIPIAFIVAAYAGVKLTGELNANLMTQVAQSIPDLGAVWEQHGFWDWSADGAGVFSSLFLLLGLSACLLHFYFSAPQNRAMQHVSRFGVLTLMLSFGASFGYTVMGRISLAIGRAQEMLGLDRKAAEVTLIVVGFLVVWRRRQGDDYTPGN